MGKIDSILCDTCGKELIVDSNYPHHFTLKLSCIDTGINTSGMAFAIAMFPLLQDDKYFCDINCLWNWLKGRGQA